MILGLGLWELLLIGLLVVALVGLKGLPRAARDAGRLYGFMQRLKQELPWLAKLPWIRRFFR
jgi:Sec-independent protein translocase protein TatA